MDAKVTIVIFFFLDFLKISISSSIYGLYFLHQLIIHIRSSLSITTRVDLDNPYLFYESKPYHDRALGFIEIYFLINSHDNAYSHLSFRDSALTFKAS